MPVTINGNGAISGLVIATGDIADGAVTLPKMANVATGTVLGRSTAGTGVPEALTTLPAVSGTNLTNLNATNLASGTVPDARFPATLPAASGANLTNLNASNLSTGTVGTARLATGTANSTTFLRGDQTWATVSGGVTSITAGNGLTGGTITTSGTIALDFYTGSVSTNTSFPIGSYLYSQNGTAGLNNNASRTLYAGAGNRITDSSAVGSAISGTWVARGNGGGTICGQYNLMQRIA